MDVGKALSNYRRALLASAAVTIVAFFLPLFDLGLVKPSGSDCMELFFRLQELAHASGGRLPVSSYFLLIVPVVMLLDAGVKLYRCLRGKVESGLFDVIFLIALLIWVGVQEGFSYLGIGWWLWVLADIEAPIVYFVHREALQLHDNDDTPIFGFLSLLVRDAFERLEDGDSTKTSDLGKSEAYAKVDKSGELPVCGSCREPVMFGDGLCGGCGKELRWGQ